MTKNYKADCVTRVDKNKVHGWYVRKKVKGKEYSKSFSDDNYGGMDDAFDAALKWRDSVADKVQQVKVETKSKIPQQLKQEISLNNSSDVGVFIVKKKRDGGKEEDHYCASWYETPNEQKTMLFSINKYGEEGAKALAIEYRKLKLDELMGRHIKRHLNWLEKKKEYYINKVKLSKKALEAASKYLPKIED